MLVSVPAVCYLVMGSFAFATLFALLLVLLVLLNCIIICRIVCIAKLSSIIII